MVLKSSLPPGAYAIKDPLGGQASPAIPLLVPAFVASSLGSGANVEGETVTKSSDQGQEQVAQVAADSGLLRTVSRISDRADGVGNYKLGTHFRLENDIINWAIRPLMVSPTPDTPVVTPGTGTLVSGTYYYTYTVRNAAGQESNWVSGMPYTTAAQLTAPLGQIQTNWAAVANAVTYRVYRTSTLDGNGYPLFVGQWNGGLLATVAGATGYLDDGTDTVVTGSNPPLTNSAGDEPQTATTYTVDYTYSVFEFNVPRKYRALEDVLRDHGFGSQAAIMSEFAMSTVPGRGNAAPAVWVVAAGHSSAPTEAPTLGDYQEAISTLELIEDEQLVLVLGGNSAELRASLKSHVLDMSALAGKRERIGIVYNDSNTAIGSSATPDTILYTANVMNHERMVLIGVDSGKANADIQDAVTGTRIRGLISPEYAAAILAGRAASLPDTAEPLTRKDIRGLVRYKGTRLWNATELKDLRDGGVLVLDYKSDSNWLVYQGVTTKTGGTVDQRELNVVLSADTLAFMWRDAIDPNPNTNDTASLIGSKITDGLLQAVVGRTINVFDLAMSNGIIRGYDLESISAVQSQPTVIDVTANYYPVFPANQIILTFASSFSPVSA